MHNAVKRGLFFMLSIALLAPLPAPAQSQSAPAPVTQRGPAPYDAFVKDATVLPGLIPIIKKEGRIYLALAKSQLDQDFIETSVPSSGLGGFGPAAGEPYVAPARIFRFDRLDDSVIMRWPNTYARVLPNTAAQTSTRESLPASVVAVVPIVAQDENTVVVSAAPFLDDIADFAAVFSSEIPNPGERYRLDKARTFFSDAKAFAQNDVLRVSQTWSTDDPNLIDNAPDPRSIEIAMTYNIIAAPHDGYVPRIADWRVGYFSQALVDFSTDNLESRTIQYVSRWNFAPEHPGEPSSATHPLVYYISNTIPVQYRDTVRRALLTWNGAFAKIGILNAVQVMQQPDDPSWDAEDIRHNVVRWIDTTSPQYGAEALIVNDPRTGEELNVGVNVDAVEGPNPALRYKFLIAPARGLHDSTALEDAYQRDALRSVVLHESGHDMGLQHNFIGSMAYTAKQLQSKAFTDRYGIASSVMEYNPINLWPKGTSQGDYDQLVLGPYDYYAIRYGYGYIASASTPEAELPQLHAWASDWSNPMHRFASDEDASFGNGHAIDPRVERYDLTNHPLEWCSTQLKMLHGIMDAVDRRFPSRGTSYDEARRAFLAPLTSYMRCSAFPADTIGGEYLSRSAAGDPNSALPLQAVSRRDNYAAWQLLDNWLFSDAAWRFSPRVLDRLTYSEVSSLSSNGSWVYNPTPRHDVPIVQYAAQAQDRALNELFAPLTLQRIDDLSTKYTPGATIGIADLFSWSRGGIFGDISSGRAVKEGVVRRNLQVRFAKRLAQMWTAPLAGTPTDAQALARLSLARLANDTNSALQAANLDDLSRAHLQALGAIAKQALEAHATIAAPPRSEMP